METPLVTIAIPVFNSEKYLEETLQSVVDQDYPFWECILVDDGSTDRSLHIIRSFTQIDDRFKSYQRNRELKGVSVCRNIAIEASKGDYLIFLDSDDLLHQECLSKRVSFMKEYPELDFAVFQMQAFGRKSFPVTLQSDDYLKSFLSFDFPWAVTSPIWKIGFLKKMGGFNEKLSILEDPELHIRALLKKPAYVVLIDHEPDCFYRQYKVFGLIKDRAYWSLIQGYATFFEETDLFPDLNSQQMKWIQNGFYRMILQSTYPFESEDVKIYRQATFTLRRNKVIDPVTTAASNIIIRLLRYCPFQTGEKALKFFWGFIIRPDIFLKELVLPKFIKKES